MNDSEKLLSFEKDKLEFERMKLQFEKDKWEFEKNQSEKNESEKNILLLEILKENWEHGRHVETERLNFTSIYVAIVGGTLAFIGENFNMEKMYSVFGFLLIFSILGFQLSKKWGNVFDSHMIKIKEILIDLSSDNFDAPKYIEMQKYKPKQSIIKSWNRTKNLFNIFYLIMIILWTVLLIVSVIKNILLYL